MRSRTAKETKHSILFAGLAVAVLLVALAVPQPAGATFQGKNGKIVFERGRGAANNAKAEIYVMDQDGSGQVRLTNNTVADSLPAFSPTGKEVAFTSRRDLNDEIYVMTAEDRDGDGHGEDLTRVTNSAHNEFQPAFSPDGDKMAFTSNQTGNNEIYVMDSDGTDPVRLTNNAARDARPAFSPEGDRVAFTSNRDRDDEIYVMDAVDRDGDGNGDNLTKITNNTVSDSLANFSPDGSTLAFTSNRDGNDEIYVANADGSGIQTRLTTDPAVDEFPAFSPEGDRVAFSSNRDGNFEIYVVDANGANPVRLTYDPEADSKPDWGPIFYDFSGFYEPVNNLPTTNAANAGGAIPVKFGLGGDQGLDVFAVDYPKSQQIDCDSAAPIDDIEETAAAGGSGLSYDAATDQYTYVWKTNKRWSDTCRQLVVKLDDSTVHVANFEFK